MVKKITSRVESPLLTDVHMLVRDDDTGKIVHSFDNMLDAKEALTSTYGGTPTAPQVSVGDTIVATAGRGVAGAASGALAGMAIPVIGPAIGATLGGATGLISGIFDVATSNAALESAWQNDPTRTSEVALDLSKAQGMSIPIDVQTAAKGDSGSGSYIKKLKETDDKTAMNPVSWGEDGHLKINVQPLFAMSDEYADILKEIKDNFNTLTPEKDQTGEALKTINDYVAGAQWQWNYTRQTAANFERQFPGASEEAIDKGITTAAIATMDNDDADASWGVVVLRDGEEHVETAQAMLNHIYDMDKLERDNYLGSLYSMLNDPTVSQDSKAIVYGELEAIKGANDRSESKYKGMITKSALDEAGEIDWLGLNVTLNDITSWLSGGQSHGDLDYFMSDDITHTLMTFAGIGTNIAGSLLVMNGIQKATTGLSKLGLKGLAKVGGESRLGQWAANSYQAISHATSNPLSWTGKDFIINLGYDVTADLIYDGAKLWINEQVGNEMDFWSEFSKDFAMDVAFTFANSAAFKQAMAKRGLNLWTTQDAYDFVARGKAEKFFDPERGSGTQLVGADGHTVIATFYDNRNVGASTDVTPPASTVDNKPVVITGSELSTRAIKAANETQLAVIKANGPRKIIASMFNDHIALSSLGNEAASKTGDTYWIAKADNIASDAQLFTDTAHKYYEGGEINGVKYTGAADIDRHLQNNLNQLMKYNRIKKVENIPNSWDAYLWGRQMFERAKINAKDDKIAIKNAEAFYHDALTGVDGEIKTALDEIFGLLVQKAAKNLEFESAYQFVSGDGYTNMQVYPNYFPVYSREAKYLPPSQGGSAKWYRTHRPFNEKDKLFPHEDFLPILQSMDKYTHGMLRNAMRQDRLQGAIDIVKTSNAYGGSDFDFVKAGEFKESDDWSDLTPGELITKYDISKKDLAIINRKVEPAKKYKETVNEILDKNLVIQNLEDYNKIKSIQETAKEITEALRANHDQAFGEYYRSLGSSRQAATASDSVAYKPNKDYDYLRNANGEIDGGRKGITSSAQNASLYDFDTTYKDWAADMGKYVADRFSALTPEEKKADPFAKKLYAEYEATHPRPDTTIDTTSGELSKEEMNTLVDSPATVAFSFTEGENGFQRLTDGTMRRALYNKGYDKLSAAEKKRVDTADQAFTQRLVENTVLYRGETAKTDRDLKVGEKLDTSSWTYTSPNPAALESYRQGLTGGEKGILPSEGILYRFHTKAGTPVFYSDTSLGEFVLPREIDATITNITTQKSDKRFTKGLKIVDVDVDPKSGVTPALKDTAPSSNTIDALYKEGKEGSLGAGRSKKAEFLNKIKKAMNAAGAFGDNVKLSDLDQVPLTVVDNVFNGWANQQATNWEDSVELSLDGMLQDARKHNQKVGTSHKFDLETEKQLALSQILDPEILGNVNKMTAVASGALKRNMERLDQETLLHRWVNRNSEKRQAEKLAEVKAGEGKVGYSYVTGETVKAIKGFPIEMMVNGEKQITYLTYKNSKDKERARELADILNAPIGYEAKESFVRVFDGIARGASWLKRQEITGWNPTKAGTNLLRDQGRALVMSGFDYAAAPQKIVGLMTNTGMLTAEQADAFWADMNRVADIARNSSLEKYTSRVGRSTQKELDRILNGPLPVDGKTKLTGSWRDKTKAQLKYQFHKIAYDIKNWNKGGLGDLAATAGDIAEDYTRIRNGENAFMMSYLQARQAGADDATARARAYEQGAWAARNTTTDFGVKGYITRKLARWAPYSFSGFSGKYSAFQSFLSDPIGVSSALVSYLLAYTACIGITLSDEESRKRYRNLTDYEKSHNFIIPIDSTGIITIPMDEDLAGFMSLYRTFVETLFTEAPTSAWTWLGSFLDNSSIDFSGLTEGDQFNIWRMLERQASDYAPTVLTMAAEQLLGRDLYYGSDIAIDEDYLASIGKNPTNAGDFTTTSKNSKTLYELANILNIPQWRLQLVVKQFGGDIGQYALWALDKLRGATDDETGGKDPIATLWKPFIGGESEASASAFYDGLNQLTNEKKTVQAKLRANEEKQSSATGSDLVKLQQEHQKIIDDFGRKTADFVGKYLAAYEMSGGLTQKQAQRIYWLFDFQDTTNISTGFNAGSVGEYYADKAKAQARQVATSNAAPVLDRYYNSTGQLYKDSNTGEWRRSDAYGERAFTNSVNGRTMQHVVDLQKIAYDNNIPAGRQAVREQIDAIYAKGNLTQEDYNKIDTLAASWDAKAALAFAPYFLKNGTDSLQLGKVVDLLDDYFIVTSDYKVDKRGRYFSAPNLNKQRGFAQQFITDIMNKIGAK